MTKLLLAERDYSIGSVSYSEHESPPEASYSRAGGLVPLYSQYMVTGFPAKYMVTGFPASSRDASRRSGVNARKALANRYVSSDLEPRAKPTLCVWRLSQRRAYFGQGRPRYAGKDTSSLQAHGSP